MTASLTYHKVFLFLRVSVQMKLILNTCLLANGKSTKKFGKEKKKITKYFVVRFNAPGNLCFSVYIVLCLVFMRD